MEKLAMTLKTWEKLKGNFPLDINKSCDRMDDIPVTIFLSHASMLVELARRAEVGNKYTIVEEIDGQVHYRKPV